MEFSGFPLGLKFILKDDSTEKRTACWQLVLSAISRFDADKLELYELSVQCGEQNEYYCIIHSNNLKQGRKLSTLIADNTALWARLSPIYPVVQENYLERYLSACVLLGVRNEDGSIVPNSHEASPLPVSIESAEQAKSDKKILVAIDSMKGRFSSHELSAIVCEQISNSTLCRAVPLLIGDGGEGTMLALVARQRGRIVHCSAHDALNNPVDTQYGVLPGNKVIIECAEAVGFSSGGMDASIMDRTSFGVGEMIAHALDAGYSDIYLCIGGTTTCDGGLGMLRALGFHFYDEDGVETEQLCRISSFDDKDVHARLKTATINAVCDVNNPLLGSAGAVAVYARQKGASDSECLELEKALGSFSKLKSDCVAVEGAGSGGGIGFGCAAFLGAKLVRGARWVLDELNFDSLAADCCAVITGEGFMDEQTIEHDKLVKNIIDSFQTTTKPIFVISGGYTDSAVNYLDKAGVWHTLCHCDSNKDEEPIARAVQEILGTETMKNALHKR